MKNKLILICLPLLMLVGCSQNTYLSITASPKFHNISNFNITGELCLNGLCSTTLSNGSSNGTGTIINNYNITNITIINQTADLSNYPTNQNLQDNLTNYAYDKVTSDGRYASSTLFSNEVTNRINNDTYILNLKMSIANSDTNDATQNSTTNLKQTIANVDTNDATINTTLNVNYATKTMLSNNISNVNSSWYNYIVTPYNASIKAYIDLQMTNGNTNDATQNSSSDTNDATQNASIDLKMSIIDSNTNDATQNASSDTNDATQNTSIGLKISIANSDTNDLNQNLTFIKNFTDHNAWKSYANRTFISSPTSDAENQISSYISSYKFAGYKQQGVTGTDNIFFLLTEEDAASKYGYFYFSSGSEVGEFRMRANAPTYNNNMYLYNDASDSSLQLNHVGGSTTYIRLLANDAISAKIDVDGGTAIYKEYISTLKVTGLATPTAPTEAAPVSYVSDAWAANSTLLNNSIKVYVNSNDPGGYNNSIKGYIAGTYNASIKGYIDGTYNASIRGYVGGTYNASIKAYADLNFIKNNTNAYLQNLGIGVTHPTSKLHVVGTGNITGVLTVTNVSYNASSYIYMNASGCIIIQTKATYDATCP